MPYLLLPIGLAVVAYSLGIATGFASDDYGWIRRAAFGQLGWDVAFQWTGHSNSLPFEIALYRLKYFLFGFEPIGYHVFALAGHIANVLLIYVLARRIGLGVQVAYIAAVLAAVLAGGSQAVYWMSGDPHVWATLGILAAMVLYIDHREKGGWWRYAAAVFLAAVAPLVKAEGVAMIGGVIAYELFWRQPRSWTWKFAPFVLTPVPFVVWEWTTTDQLQSRRGFGLNVVTGGLDYLRQILLPFDPRHFISGPGSSLHQLLNIGIGTTLYLEGAAVAVLLLLALRARQTYGLVLFAVTGSAPALVVTLGTQSRYAYFAGLLVSLVAAIGGMRLLELLRTRLPGSHVVIPVAVGVAFVAGIQLWMTVQASSALRVAHSESLAFRAAVLSDHAYVPDDAPICLLDSPLDVGSARAVFSDPRLGANVGIPAVTECGSAERVPKGTWGYQRQPDGSYRQIR